jgi:hypothetical protein
LRGFERIRNVVFVHVDVSLLYICTEVQPSVHANGAAGLFTWRARIRFSNPRAVPIGVGRGIGAEIRQAGLAAMIAARSIDRQG